MDVKKEPPNNKNLRIFFQMTTWHWIIAINAMIATFIDAMVPHSFGTFIAYFKVMNKTKMTNNELYHPNKKLLTSATQFQLNWIPVLSSALPCVLLPIFGIVVKKFHQFYQILALIGFIIITLSCILSSLINEWPIFFITYSLLYSIGSSILLAVVVSILAEYFPSEHRFHVFATSLYQIGYILGSLIGNPVVAELIKRYDWQMTLKYIALIQFLFGSFIALLLKPLFNGIMCFKTFDSSSSETEVIGIYRDQMTESSTYLDETTNSLTSLDATVINKLQFWLWMFAKFMNYACWYSLRTNIVTYLVKTTNFSLATSANMMSIYAGAELIVALMGSMIGDKIKGWLIHVHFIVAGLMSVICGIFPLYSGTILGSSLLMLFVGFSVQLSISYGYPGSVEVLESESDISNGWIITNVALGTGILTSPVLFGLIMDKYSPKIVFWILSGIWALQMLLYLSIILLMRSNTKSKKSQYKEFEYKR